MEINQTKERKVYNVTAEQDEWTVNASVAIVDDKISVIEGSAFKRGNDGQESKGVAFSCYRNGVQIMRTVHNVSDDTIGVYDILEYFIGAVKTKYEGE